MMLDDYGADCFVCFLPGKRYQLPTPGLFEGRNTCEALMPRKPRRPGRVRALGSDSRPSQER